MTQPITSFTHDAAEITLQWADTSSAYHLIWLRDHCHCEQCYHSVTKQRLLNIIDIPEDLSITSASLDNAKSLSITWNDGHISVFLADFLWLHSYNPILETSKIPSATEHATLKLWDVKEIYAAPPLVNFKDVMDSEAGVDDWVIKIWQYGFCFVENTPIDPIATEKLICRLNYIRPTHYGGFWDFTSNLAVNDTAYTTIAIPSHTDGTYWTEAPGLQLFHLLKHEGHGGGTSLVDAFQCAKQFKLQEPYLYEMLSTVPLTCHLAGEADVCIQPSYDHPVFIHDYLGELIQVRWNQSDRSTLSSAATFSKLDPKDVPVFYEALRKWTALISSPENEWFLQLQPGQCLMFDNWRVLHSRTEFTGERRMCGAYIGRDEFLNRLKAVYVREDLTATL
ncbi:hypothetical protein BABINDRAFT_81523 [Babjeviella inositovora NRRL Y-12698]|uniref:Trimethyllysine dioxygenase n=1 Tax=Babjeviella inositovora NRRL Y-12698 TaxID=984486 RepID=A0A1E3QZN6_9ASCO|nr:uncharacterized protein BABINDRAFT_81523 [Babjeviella inositovora NRRL Y-12698]ODQ83140.1 hypothetical protein BABINDRAFT_81523 [Babjeviella inositovora NRRL Y-12698]